MRLMGGTSPKGQTVVPKVGKLKGEAAALRRYISNQRATKTSVNLDRIAAHARGVL